MDTENLNTSVPDNQTDSQADNQTDEQTDSQMSATEPQQEDGKKPKGKKKKKKACEEPVQAEAAEEETDTPPPAKKTAKKSKVKEPAPDKSLPESTDDQSTTEEDAPKATKVKRERTELLDTPKDYFRFFMRRAKVPLIALGMMLLSVTLGLAIGALQGMSFNIEIYNDRYELVYGGSGVSILIGCVVGFIFWMKSKANDKLITIAFFVAIGGVLGFLYNLPATVLIKNYNPSLAVSTNEIYYVAKDIIRKAFICTTFAAIVVAELFYCIHSIITKKEFYKLYIPIVAVEILLCTGALLFVLFM